MDKTITENLENTLKLPVKQKVEILPYEQENYSLIEKSIIDLSEQISNLNELKDAIEHSFKTYSTKDELFQTEVINYFNSMRDSFDNLNFKLNNEIDYTRDLETKLQNNEYKGQIYLLDKELLDERAKITLFMDDINKTIKSTLQIVNEKCLELKSAEQQINDAILKFRTDSFSASENEYKALKQKTETFLEKFINNAQKNLETMKKYSIEFINQCQKENKKLIESIPEVKGKMSMESWIVIIMGCIGIASFFIKLF